MGKEKPCGEKIKGREGLIEWIGKRKGEREEERHETVEGSRSICRSDRRR